MTIWIEPGSDGSVVVVTNVWRTHVSWAVLRRQDTPWGVCANGGEVAHG